MCYELIQHRDLYCSIVPKPSTLGKTADDKQFSYTRSDKSAIITLNCKHWIIWSRWIATCVSVYKQSRVLAWNFNKKNKISLLQVHDNREERHCFEWRKNGVTATSVSLSLLCQQWVCRHPVFNTFHMVDEEEKCVCGTRRGGEGLQLLALVLWNHIKHTKAPSYLNCCCDFAPLGLQMCHRGPTVGSPCKKNHATGPQAPLPVKGIGAQPASPHPIAMLVWLGTQRGGKSLGEATRLPSSCWLPGWPKSWEALKSRGHDLFPLARCGMAVLQPRGLAI